MSVFATGDEEMAGEGCIMLSPHLSACAWRAGARETNQRSHAKTKTDATALAGVQSPPTSPLRVCAHVIKEWLRRQGDICPYQRHSPAGWDESPIEPPPIGGYGRSAGFSGKPGWDEGDPFGLGTGSALPEAGPLPTPETPQATTSPARIACITASVLLVAPSLLNTRLR